MDKYINTLNYLTIHNKLMHYYGTCTHFDISDNNSLLQYYRF